MKYDRKKMREDLLKRTDESYNRREGETNMKYFKTDAGIKLWKCQPTKTSPHIVDILPFFAGPNFPVPSGIQDGDWAYVLDLIVHNNVGPNKRSVVCPNKNFNQPCPICEEVDRLLGEGVDWNDIHFVPSRRAIYNVLVMDDAKTEAMGVQVWETPHSYFEKVIVALAKSPRGGGSIPFSSPEQDLGKSIVFEVGSDTYRKMSGHRFENRDYDIPDELLDQAKQLDQIIVVHGYDELRKIARFEEGETSDSKEPSETESSGRPLRNRGNSTGNAREKKEEKDVPDMNNPCPSNLNFGNDFDKFAECNGCSEYQACAEAGETKESAKETTKESAKEESSSGRRLLRRGR